jgi:hypothetical protein
VLILHDYSQLIAATSNTLGHSGYIDKETEKELAKAQTQYEHAREDFVYAALKRQPDEAWVKSQILDELAAMEREQGPCLGEFATLRHDLPREIDKQAAMSGTLRSAWRWGRLALSAIALVLFVLLKGAELFGFFGLFD